MFLYTYNKWIILWHLTFELYYNCNKLQINPIFIDCNCFITLRSNLLLVIKLNRCLCINTECYLKIDIVLGDDKGMAIHIGNKIWGEGGIIDLNVSRHWRRIVFLQIQPISCNRISNHHIVEAEEGEKGPRDRIQPHANCAKMYRNLSYSEVELIL